MNDRAYQAHHRWLRKQLGAASVHTCENCGQQALDWAYDEPSGYAYDTARYRPLCRRCHIAVDKINPNRDRTHCRRGHEFSPENTYTYNGHRQCKACRRLTWKLRKS